MNRYLFFTISAVLLAAGCSSGPQAPPAWEELPGLYGRDVSAFAVDPGRPGQFIAGVITGELYRSSDGGTTWQHHQAFPSTGGVRTLVAHPDRPRAVYAGTDDGLYLSPDFGATWNRLPLTTGGATRITCVVFDPWKPSTIFAGTRDAGLLRSTDDGKNWTAMKDTSLARTTITSVAIDPRGPDRVYATCVPLGVLASTDAGSSWRILTPGFGPTGPAATQLCISQGSAVVYGTSTGAIFRSTDGGDTWSQARQGQAWGSVLSLATDRRSDAVYAATDAGILRSTDNGSTWLPASRTALRVPTRLVLTSGQTATAIHVYGPATGVQESTDGGATWRSIDRGLGGASIHLIASIPVQGSTIYAACDATLHLHRSNPAGWTVADEHLQTGVTTCFTFSPGPPATLYAATSAGSFRSTDGGKEWETFARGARTIPVTILLHPWLASRVFASSDDGLFVSTDRGVSWSETRPIGKRYHARAVLFSKTNAGLGIAATEAHGVLLTADGGLTWEPARMAVPDQPLVSAARDDEDEKLLYTWTSTGLCFRSIDAGRSWERYAQPWSQADTALVVSDAENRSSVVALVNSRTVWMSETGGTAWSMAPAQALTATAQCVSWNAATRTLVTGTRNRGVFQLRVGTPANM